MIKYSLVCSNGHEFEGWFSTGEEYNRLEASGHLACAVCGDNNISKMIMAPSVNSPKKRQGGPSIPSSDGMQAGAVPSVASSKSGTLASLPPQMRKEFIEQVRTFRKQVTETAENVGDKFAEEARKIHYGESEERGIYGQAKAEDAADLLEEGISVFPIPELPEDRN